MFLLLRNLFRLYFCICLKPIELNKTLKDIFPEYTLYRVRSYWEEKRNDWYRGTPAIFIHGHEGSQHDVGLNGEMSAFYGKFLESQSRFVYECIKHILTFYRRHNSVIVLGHSMGGVVAMGMVGVLEFDPDSVAAMILLASPVQLPVVSLEKGVSDFYDDFHERWKNETLIERIPLVSIGGGEEDVLVRTALTSFSKIGDFNSDSNALWTSTTSIPLVWLSLNHLEFIWCEELLTVVSRALYEIADDDGIQTTRNESLIRNVFKHHFSTNYGKRFFLPPPSESSTIDFSLPWREIEMPWSASARQSGYVVTRFENPHAGVMVLSNSTDVDWVGACKVVEGTKCTSVVHLSTRASLLPSPTQEPFKFLQLLPQDLEPFNRIVFLQESDRPVHIAVESLSSDNVLKIDVPSIILLNSETLLLNGSLNSFYNISLQGFTSVLQAFTLSCGQPDLVIIKFFTSWGGSSVYNVTGESKSLLLKLISNQPTSKLYENPQLHIFLPTKGYVEITLKPSLKEGLNQLMKFYIMLLPAFALLPILGSLQSHLGSLIVSGKYSSLFLPVLHWINFLIVPIVFFWKLFSRCIRLDDLMRFLGIQGDDIDLLKDTNTWNVFVFIFLQLSFFCITSAISSACKLLFILIFKLITCCSESLHGLKRPTGLLHSLIPIAAFIVSFCTCGGLGLLLMMIFCFLRVFIRLNKKSSKASIILFNYNISLFFLSVFHFLLNFVTFFLWSSGETRFSVKDDPSIIHAAISALTYFIINMYSYPESSRKSCYIGFILSLQLIPFFVVTHATVSIYMISFLIDAVLGMLALHAMAAALLTHFRKVVVVNDDDDDEFEMV